MDMAAMFAKTQESMASLAKAQSDFMALMKIYMQTGDISDWPEVEEEPRGDDPADSVMLTEYESDGTEQVYPVTGYDSYTEGMIDIDDPRFAGGFALGLPYSVNKNSTFGRGPADQLLPIIGGMFREI